MTTVRIIPPAITGKADIRVDPGGVSGQILIGGHDIAPAVRGFTLDARVGQPPVLRLDLRLIDVSTFDTPAGTEVMVPEQTVEALKRLGWTPPE